MNFCIAVQPVPPYSCGQPGAIQPFSYSAFCQETIASLDRYDGVRRTTSRTVSGRFSRRNPRTSSRNARSDSLKLISILKPLHRYAALHCNAPQQDGKPAPKRQDSEKKYPKLTSFFETFYISSPIRMTRRIAIHGKYCELMRDFLAVTPSAPTLGWKNKRT